MTNSQPGLREALRALYGGASDAERHAADAWLQAFTGTPDAWRALLQLLADPAAAEHERFFAATALRPLCCRRKELAEPGTGAAVAQLLAQQFAAAAAGARCWHTANQLAAALATVLLRAPAWPESQLLPQLLALLPPAGAANGGSGGSRQHLAAQLHLLTALAEAACSKDVGMHPQRREAARAALSAAPELLPAVQQALALASADPALPLAALQLLQAWCALGAPPAGAEGTEAVQLWRQLHQAALHPGLGSAAAEALAALYASCCAPEAGADEPRLAAQRQQLLTCLLGLLPGFASELQAALRHAPSPQAQGQLLFAALALLGAAAAAADSPRAPAAAPGLQPAAAQAVALAAEAALAALQHPHFDVTLATLQHWDEQLERWREQRQQQQQQRQRHQGACSQEQRAELLGRLCGALLQRMVLPAHLPPARTTADARDLPDEVQQVRREVSDTFRAAADALGAAATRQQLLQLAAEAQAAWQAGGGWHQYESCLFALNLVWGRQRSQQHDAAAVAEVQAAAAAAAAALHPGCPKLAGTALTLLGGMAEQLLLLEPPALQQLLEVLVRLVQQPGDARLARNAATACHRLAGCRPLAATLAARHPAFSAALCRCFAAAGGMRQRAQQGEDLSTPQFLLVAICHLAAGAAGAAGGGAAGSSSGGGELLLQLLRQPAQAAEAALAAAAAAGGEQQQQLLLEQAALHLDTIAVALEAAAGSSSRGSSSGSSSSSSGGSSGGSGVQAASPMARQLPAVISSLAGVLQQAVAAAGTAGCAQPQLLQAVCRVAAAAACTPAADRGLELLQPFAAVPPHPCILQTLAEVAACRCQLSGSGVQALQAAAGASIRAAAAQHGSDPDWQPALLRLGVVCLAQLPALVADGPTLDALLEASQHSLRSYHRGVCEAVLPFVEALCCAGTAAAGNAGRPSAAAAAAAAADPAASAAAQQLQQRLDGGGLGPALVLGLLLAAAGSMPPYMVVQIADTLHRSWRAAGGRFGAWFREAALARAPDAAPWRRWKPDAQAAAVADLLSPACAQDARRFKRLLKVLCGGKKKGQHDLQPPREG